MDGEKCLYSDWGWGASRTIIAPNLGPAAAQRESVSGEERAHHHHNIVGIDVHVHVLSF